MKLVGYRPMVTWVRNYVIYGFRHGRGKLRCCGRAVCDVAKTAKLCLWEELVLGANLRKGSRAETYLKIRKNAELHVTGRFQVFFGASIEVFENGRLTLGKGYINTGGAIACAKKITIGDGVFIGRNTYITDSDHHCLYNSGGKQTNEPAEVWIGNHVLIGYGATVLKGVTIGDGAVIAAGAVVVEDVPEKCMAAGVPARIVREDVVWK